MEYSMKLVEKHCAKYLTMFGECIQRYPYTWQMDCEAERRKLAKCAETNPEILHIKKVCGTEFHVYEKCMGESRSDAERCTESFNVFSSCASEALKSYIAPNSVAEAAVEAAAAKAKKDSSSGSKKESKTSERESKR